MLTQYFIDATYLGSILIIFIYAFLTFTLFLLLNTFDSKHIKNLSDLKKFGLIFPLNLLFLITILSFAGVPPLFGFSIKLVLFLLLINGTSYFYIIILAVFNFFVLYFYIQNVRYIINTSSNNLYIYINNFAHISEILMFILITALLINIGGFIYLSDLMLYFSNFLL